MALTKQELGELAQLLNTTDVQDTFSLGDLGRRSILENKATDKQLWKAAQMAGIDSEQFNDIYPDFDWSKVD